MSAHIDPIRVAGLAALIGSDDLETREALAHAADCPECARLFAEAQAVLRLMDQGRPQAPSEAVLHRVKRALLDEIAMPASAIAAEVGAARVAAPAQSGNGARAATRAPAFAPQISRGTRFVLPLAVLAVFGFLIATARHPIADPARWATAVAALGLAAACSWLAVSGRKIELAISLIAAASLIALTAQPDEFSWQGGGPCFAMEILGAAVPFAMAAFLVRRRRLPASAALFAGVACAGALSAEAALDLTCGGAGSAPHAWVFHFGGFVVALAVAYLGGRMLSGVAVGARSRSS